MATEKRDVCQSKSKAEGSRRDVPIDAMMQRSKRHLEVPFGVEERSCCPRNGMIHHWIRRFRETPPTPRPERENVPFFIPPDAELFRGHRPFHCSAAKAWTPPRAVPLTPMVLFERSLQNEASEVLRCLDVLNLQSDATLRHCEQFLQRSAAYDRLLLRLLNKYQLPSTRQRIERVTKTTTKAQRRDADAAMQTENILSYVKALYAGGDGVEASVTATMGDFGIPHLGDDAKGLTSLPLAANRPLPCPSPTSPGENKSLDQNHRGNISPHEERTAASEREPCLDRVVADLIEGIVRNAFLSTQKPSSYTATTS